MTSRDPVAHIAVGLAAMLAFLFWPLHHASADSSVRGRLVLVSQANHGLTLRLTGDGLPSGTTFDPSSAVVDVNGERVSGVQATADHAPDGNLDRRAVLVVDTSGSMAGTGVDGAKRAANAYLAVVPPDVAVGLVTFSDRPRLAVAPTTSRSQIRAAVSHLRASGRTGLYDAVTMAVGLLGHAGDRSLVVLSDGADTGSVSSLRQVDSLLRRSGARMDAVAFHTGNSVRRYLKEMADATGGRVTSAADASGLAASFTEAARSFSTGLTLVFAPPANQKNRTVHIDVTARAGATAVQASADVRIPAVAVAAGHGSTRGLAPSRHLPMAPFLVLFLGLAGLSWTALHVAAGRRSPAGRTRRLLQSYTYAGTAASPEQEPKGTGIARSFLARGACTLANRLVANPARREKLAIQLSRANVGLKPGDWLVVQMLVVGSAVAVGIVMFGSILAGLILAALGYAGSVSWLSIKGQRRVRAFDDQLPGSLQMVAGSLRAGFSLSQALDAVVREGMEPMAAEMHRALAEVRLGVSIEDALQHIADRMDSVDFRWVVMAIRIQHEVGGNLAEVLLTTASTMRDRASLRRQVKALSAEGRLSAYILFALPVVMSLYLFAFRREYVRPLYTERLGVGMLVIAATLLGVGALAMRKIVMVEA